MTTTRAFDAAVIVTAHSNVDYAQLASWCDCIVDSRNVFGSSGLVRTGANVTKA